MASSAGSGAARRPRLPSVRQSLLVLLLAVLVPLGVVAAALVAYQWDQQRERGLADLQEHARLLRYAVDRELTLDIAVLKALAASGDLDRGDWKTVHEVARRASEGRPGSWIIGMDATGQNTFNTAVPFGTVLPNLRRSLAGGSVEWQGRQLPLPTLPMFEEPLRTGLPAFSGLVYGRSSKRPVVATNVPVMRPGGATQVLGIAYSPDAYLKVVLDQIRDGALIAAVVDDKGLVIARNQNPEKFVGVRAAPPFDRGSAALPQEGIGETLSLDAVPVYYAYSRSRVTGWISTVGIPSSTLLAPARRAAWASTAFVAAMSLLAIGFALRLSRRISAPLATLAERAHAESTTFDDVPPSGIGEVEELKGAMLRAALAQEQRRRSEAAREAAQRALEAANARLLEADRRKDEFLAMLGHELRNPLAAIQGAAQVLVRRSAPADGPDARMSAIVARQTRHLARIVDDLLDVARVTHGKMALHCGPLQLGQVARSVADAAREQADGKSLQLEVRVPPALGIDGDETRIAQVLSNLLDNAIKYTPPGGRIVLTVEPEADEAVVRVVDTGAGIAVDLLPHVFEPFTQHAQTIERSQGGLGLGLAIVKRIVELHGGRIEVRSDGPGQGTEVELRFPATC